MYVLIKLVTLFIKNYNRKTEMRHWKQQKTIIKQLADFIYWKQYVAFSSDQLYNTINSLTCKHNKINNLKTFITHRVYHNKNYPTMYHC